ncbi:hypothetical protein [Enterococcus caccae]|uniref:hypothetical protein n=1 Tax=Enterococcus caccae TaxID=317735 RepID=UPI00116013F7|nr:hypothetical protein [Enterococcus caccae]
MSGWLLLITEEKEEYLVRQNSEFIGFRGFNIKRQMYKSEVSLKNKTVQRAELNKVKKKAEFNYIGITVVAIVGPVLRNNVPKDWIWGDTNLPINSITGMLNILLLWLLVSLCFSVISFYRKKFFEYYLKKLKSDLVFVGKGYQSKRHITKKTIPKKSAIISVIIMFVFFISLTVILPFIVQERLFTFITIVILVILFFNGNVHSNEKTVNYKIALSNQQTC